GVVHAGVLVARQVRDVQPAVVGAGGDEEGPAPHVGAVAEVNRQVPAVGGEAGPHTGTAELGTELDRLQQGPAGEVVAGDPHRKTKVVLDPAAGAGLPADGDRLHEEGGQALGRAVDGGGEARR